MCYSGVETVSRVDDGIVGQGEDFLSDHLKQQFMVASRKVAAADAALEKYVAADEEFVGGVVQADAAVAVAGRVEHAETLIAETDFVALLQKSGWCGHLFHRQSECYGVSVSLVVDAHTSLMAPYRHVEMSGAPFVAGNMVDVRVRVDNGFDCQMMGLHILLELLVLKTLAVARVDDYRLTRLVMQNQRVDLYGVEMKSAYCHSLKPLRQIPYKIRK